MATLNLIKIILILGLITTKHCSGKLLFHLDLFVATFFGNSLTKLNKN